MKLVSLLLERLFKGKIVIKIYAIHDKDGKCYVGSTIQPMSMRLSAHLYTKRNNGQSSLRQLSGDTAEDFFIDILMECEDEDRFIMEEFWIKELNAVNAYKKASGPSSEEVSKKCGKKASKYWADRWKNNYEETKRMVNAHKTTEFQKMANKAAHKKLYDMKPLKEVFCAITNKSIGKFKTDLELCEIIGFKSMKTAYFYKRGMSGNSNYSKYYFREVRDFGK